MTTATHAAAAELVAFRVPSGQPDYAVYVRNLAPTVTYEELLTCMQVYGPVYKIRFRQPQTFAIVHYYSTLAAKRALTYVHEVTLHGLKLAGGRPMRTYGFVGSRELSLGCCFNLANYYFGSLNWSSKLTEVRQVEQESGKQAELALPASADPTIVYTARVVLIVCNQSAVIGQGVGFVYKLKDKNEAAPPQQVSAVNPTSHTAVASAVDPSVSGFASAAVAVPAAATTTTHPEDAMDIDSAGAAETQTAIALDSAMSRLRRAHNRARVMAVNSAYRAAFKMLGVVELSTGKIAVVAPPMPPPADTDNTFPSAIVF